jgi:hypothetical protein
MTTIYVDPGIDSDIDLAGKYYDRDNLWRRNLRKLGREESEAQDMALTVMTLLVLFLALGFGLVALAPILAG